jgi:hypothetical protein
VPVQSKSFASYIVRGVDPDIKMSVAHTLIVRASALPSDNRSYMRAIAHLLSNPTGSLEPLAALVDGRK